jgi:hypothetical protein
MAATRANSLVDLPFELLTCILTSSDVGILSNVALTCTALHDVASRECVRSGLLNQLVTHVQLTRFTNDDSPNMSAAVLLMKMTGMSAIDLIKALWPYLDPRRPQSTLDAVHIMELSPSAVGALHVSFHGDALTNAWLFGGAAAAVSRRLVVYSATAVLDARLASAVQCKPRAAWTSTRQIDFRWTSSDFEAGVRPHHNATSWCTALPLIMHAKRLSHWLMLRKFERMHQAVDDAAEALGRALESYGASGEEYEGDVGMDVDDLGNEGFGTHDVPPAQWLAMKLECPPEPCTPFTLEEATDTLEEATDMPDTPDTPDTPVTPATLPPTSAAPLAALPLSNPPPLATPVPQQPATPLATPSPRRGGGRSSVPHVHVDAPLVQLCTDTDRCAGCGEEFALLDDSQRLPFKHAFEMFQSQVCARVFERHGGTYTCQARPTQQEVHEQVRPQMEQACWACLNSYFVQRLVQAELDA